MALSNTLSLKGADPFHLHGAADYLVALADGAVPHLPLLPIAGRRPQVRRLGSFSLYNQQSLPCSKNGAPLCLGQSRLARCFPTIGPAVGSAPNAVGVGQNLDPVPWRVVVAVGREGFQMRLRTRSDWKRKVSRSPRSTSSARRLGNRLSLRLLRRFGLRVSVGILPWQLFLVLSRQRFKLRRFWAGADLLLTMPLNTWSSAQSAA